MRLVASESPVRQFTKLEPAPRRWDRDWWSHTDDTTVMSDMKNITDIAVAVGDNDTVELMEAATSEPLENGTVLVVHDEPVMRKVIVKILRQFGYRVLEASGTAEARHLTDMNRKINLMLTNFSMPETNGMELARWCQRKYPEVKVLITTGSMWELANQLGQQEMLVPTGSMWKLANQFYGEEQVAVLPKPFDCLQLGRILRLILG